MILIVDLDGTLLDVSARHHRVYCLAAESVGSTPLAKDRYWGMKRAAVPWDAVLDATGVRPSSRTLFMDAFVAAIESPHYLSLDQLWAGVSATLRELRFAHELHLVTLRRSESETLRQIGDVGIAALFDSVHVGRGNGPADRQKLRLFLRIVGSGRGVVVVGDTEADVRAAQQLGASSIAVESGSREESLLSALDPDYLVASFVDVPSALRDLEIGRGS